MSWNPFPITRTRPSAGRKPGGRVPRRPVVERLEPRELLSVDLPVTAATYLSGPNADNATAVDIAPDSTIVLAGKVDGNDFGITPTDLLGGGTGAVLRFDPTGTQLLSLARLPGTVRDMEVDRSTGDIAVIGDSPADGTGYRPGISYVAVLLPDASDLVWSVTVAAGSTNERVAIGADGTVAALVNKTVTTYGAGGNLLGQWTLGNTLVNDVAVDPASGSVFVAADDNKTLPGGGPVRVAVVYSYDYYGDRQWTDYGWPGSALAGNEADTNAVRVAMGRDGLLYLAGWSAGGNSMFRKDPHDLGTNAPNVAYDNYTNPFNTGSNNITYVARLNPLDGGILKGQFILTRQSNGRGNTLNPFAVAADESGRVYVGGSAAAFIANRDQQTIAGQPVGPYRGDGFVLVISPDFNTREVWTTWSGGPDGGSSRVNGIAAGLGIAAMAADVTAGTMITASALQDTPGHDPTSAAPAAFFSAWPAPGPRGLIVDDPGAAFAGSWNTDGAVPAPGILAGPPIVVGIPPDNPGDDPSPAPWGSPARFARSGRVRGAVGPT